MPSKSPASLSRVVRVRSSALESEQRGRESLCDRQEKIEVDRRAMSDYPPEDLLAARGAFNEHDIRSVCSFRSAL